MHDKSISVVLPVYNEEDNIRDVVKAAFDFLPSITGNFEIITVDDGSTDKTPQILKALEVSDSRLKIIRHPRNEGYGAALAAGFKKAEKELILMMDADRQFDISELSKFLLYINDYDTIAGFRLKRKDSIYRCLLGRLGSFCINILFGICMKDIKCGFKLFKAKVFKKMFLSVKSKGGGINIEIMAFTKTNHLRLKEVGVHHYSRIHGKQTGASLKSVARGILDALRLKGQLIFGGGKY